MKVVRRWSTKTSEKHLPLGSALLLSATLLLTACNPTEITPNGTRSGVVVNDGSIDGHAYIYRDSPSILASSNYGPGVDISRFVDRARPELITTNTTLDWNCVIQFPHVFLPSQVSRCINSKSKRDPAEQKLVRNGDRTWIFPVATPEFYQVNALFHLQYATTKFLTKLKNSYTTVRNVTGVPRAIPLYLNNSGMFWFKALNNTNNQLFKSTTLTSYSQCNLDRNAQFSPAGPDLCFGNDATRPGFFLVQDPSVIYHELGHAFVSIMMNLRNGTNPINHHDFRSNLGSFGYDEAGSLNEGISDYFSFVMNRRTHIGEWALGRTAKISRPMSERDDLHVTGIDTTTEGRLSYPQYLLYDPNNPSRPIENVHQAGQIVSHFLVALTEELQQTCSVSEGQDAHEESTEMVVLLLAETLAEIGDLIARGGMDTDSGPQLSRFYNNLDGENSFLWTHVINKTSYRRFFQIFAKNSLKYITGSRCPAYGKNEIERLLDAYGLLLFRNYNDNYKSTKRTNGVPDQVIPGKLATKVSEENVRKSVLVSKQQLRLSSMETNQQAGIFVIDGRDEMESLLRNLLFKGFPIPISKGVAGIEYNNNNLRISPGEILAIIPNLYNASNSTMAGVQILATDWDHMDLPDIPETTNLDTTRGHYKPCEFDPNSPVNVDQGAVKNRTCSSTLNNFQRAIPIGGNFPNEAVMPACLVLQEDEQGSRWVSQNEFRKKQGLSLQYKDCLGYSATGSQADQDFTFNPQECLVRFLPGVNDAFFSKIDARKTYLDSVITPTERDSFNFNNTLFLEVNKWIPPGTKFLCRLRARFANCSDCYSDPTDTTLKQGDYVDSDYNGHKPFQIINFEFEVND